MRIAFIVPVFPELSQTFVLSQITGLIDRGHDIMIFSRSTPSTTVMHGEVETYKLLQKTCYYRKEYLEFKKTKSRVGRYLNGIAHLIRLLPVRPKSALLACLYLIKTPKNFSLGTFFQLMPFFRYGKFDVIYCHFGDMGQFGLWLKKLKILGGKLVTVFHGYDMSTYLKKYGNDIYSNLLADGDLFLPISHYWENKLIRLGCSANKIQVHRMGIDLQQFDFIRRPITKDQILILSVARLVEKKGLEYGIKALSIVKKDIPTIKYIIAGDGPLRKKMVRLIDQVSLQEEVELVGYPF